VAALSAEYAAAAACGAAARAGLRAHVAELLYAQAVMRVLLGQEEAGSSEAGGAADAAAHAAAYAAAHAQGHHGRTHSRADQVFEGTRDAHSLGLEQFKRLVGQLRPELNASQIKQEFHKRGHGHALGARELLDLLPDAVAALPKLRERGVLPLKPA
jgi:hypothetical protein